jgi:hypothetical protein
MGAMGPALPCGTPSDARDPRGALVAEPTRRAVSDPLIAFMAAPSQARKLRPPRRADIEQANQSGRIAQARRGSSAFAAGQVKCQVKPGGA